MHTHSHTHTGAYLLTCIDSQDTFTQIPRDIQIHIRYTHTLTLTQSHTHLHSYRLTQSHSHILTKTHRLTHTVTHTWTLSCTSTHPHRLTDSLTQLHGHPKLCTDTRGTQTWTVTPPYKNSYTAHTDTNSHITYHWPLTITLQSHPSHTPPANPHTRPHALAH